MARVSRLVRVSLGMASSEVMDVALNHGSPLSLVTHVAMGAARKVHGASVSHEAAGIRSRAAWHPG